MKARVAAAVKLVMPILTAVVFGFVYQIIDEKDPNAFQFNDKLDAFYFSFTTMSTAGFGDFSPKTAGAKIAVMIQQALIMCEILAVLTSAVQIVTGGAKLKAP